MRAHREQRAQSIHRASMSAAGSKGRIVHFCDLDPSRAGAVASQYGADAGTNWTESVKRNDVDIVVVATVNKNLAPISTEALRSGKHVLCEKPLGRNVGESIQIQNVAGITA